MSDWLHNLPIFWMSILVFAGTYLATAAIYAFVAVLATSRRAAAFKAVSPALLSPLGVIFGLFVVFTAIQVWNDNDHANAAVDREASSLKAVVLLAGSFPDEQQERLRSLIASHIKEAVAQEWPMMSHRKETLSMTPQYLAQALELTLALNPTMPGQATAQREIAVELDSALDARRQRILVSRAGVSLFKWTCLLLQAACVLFAVALPHSDDRLTSGVAMGVFATGVATCLLLIVGYDRPFIGQFAVGPQPLLQVLPEASRVTGTGPSYAPGQHP